ncbi:substrate-binding periplasmic protein [Ideonella sp.]|uniref:substrate-binding periplasmic protein n=1 Tax=Ideonella sp. TaxID=1929293 RepID=UPI0035AED90B
MRGLLSFALLCASLHTPEAVAADGTPPGKPPRIQAVTEESSYTYLAGGKVGGPATEIVEASLRRAGLADYRIGLYPWARSYDMALQEPNTLIYLIARTPAREELFKWAGEFLRIDYHLYKLRARTDVDVRRLDDARPYTIGVMRDDVRHQYLQSRGFSRLVISARNSDSLRMLLDRRVDLLPLPETDMERFCREAGVDPARLQRVLTLDEMSTGIYMAFSRGTDDAVVARARAAFEQLRQDGTVARLMQRRR